VRASIAELGILPPGRGGHVFHTGTLEQREYRNGSGLPRSVESFSEGLSSGAGVGSTEAVPRASRISESRVRAGPSADNNWGQERTE
jgi:hypothetical protein